MNAGAATAFLPNFVWFPSLRGLPAHLFTHPARRTSPAYARPAPVT